MYSENRTFVLKIRLRIRLTSGQITMTPINTTEIPLYHVVVHCVIFGFPQNKLRLLVVEHNGGALDFPRCFMKQQESLDETATDLLNGVAQAEGRFLKQVCTFINKGYDHDHLQTECIHVVYFTLLPPQTELNDSCGMTLKWADLDSSAFAAWQQEIILWARNKLKRRISVEPVAFRLLPELFTLSQLQSLYEQISGMPIDKRNFRKRVNEMRYIERTELIDKSGSKRGAHLFRFNDNIYARSRTEFKL